MGASVYPLCGLRIPLEATNDPQKPAAKMPHKINARIEVVSEVRPHTHTHTHTHTRFLAAAAHTASAD